MSQSTARPPLNLGHRGASGLAPENTLAAFKLARELGADGIECDVQLSRDGEPVVIHDDLLDRTTDGHGRVGDATWDELRTLNAGSWFAERFRGERIPSLHEVLEQGDEDFVLNIELKSAEDNALLPERVVAMVKHYGAARRVIISSFNWPLLRHVRRIDATLQVGVLFSRPVEAADYEDLNPEALHPERSLVTAALIDQARARSRAVNVWTVNTADDMRRMVSMGVDAIITNHPERLALILRDLTPHPAP